MNRKQFLKNVGNIVNLIKTENDIVNTLSNAKKLSTENIRELWINRQTDEMLIVLNPLGDNGDKWESKCKLSHDYESILNDSELTEHNKRVIQEEILSEKRKSRKNVKTRWQLRYIEIVRLYHSYASIYGIKTIFPHIFQNEYKDEILKMISDLLGIYGIKDYKI